MQIIKYFGAIIATTALVTAPVYAEQASDATPAPAATMKKAQHKQNWKTEQAVHRALSRTKGLDARDIVVVARNGAVTLDGTVPDASQIQLAQNATQSVPNVNSVANNLSVKGPGN